MAAVFEVADIFEIANQIEIAGATFYRTAAQHTDGDAKTLLLKLAELEDSHKSYFETVKHAYGLDEIENLVDSHSEEAQFLLLIAKGHVVHHLQNFFSESELTVTAILKKAIEFEKDTVMYFVALKAALVSEDEKAKVEMLILEESSHVGLLSRKLREFERFDS